MNLPDELLECLHIKKVEMCVEVNSFQDEIKSYLVIFQIYDVFNLQNKVC
ncbi:MAG: hypothetical protein Q8900_10645 [Bacillota bacterium]|nr:hypothetical protein [Bacillota bacterium]